jgi:SAM-dependent methyltransferase
VTDRYAAEWEALARREPYFTLLTDTSTTVPTAAFFDAGEADVSTLLGTIASLLSRELPLTSVLDFGCGAGRLTLPLARRATRVMACDLSPTMLLHARQNAERAGLHNISFLLAEKLAELAPATFDFICSLLVLQYVPTADGYALIARLAGLLAPGGVAALHLTVQRPGSGVRRLVRFMRTPRFTHRRRAAARGEERRPAYLRVHEYDEGVVLDVIEAAGGRVVARLAAHDGDPAGAVLIVEKRPTL